MAYLGSRLRRLRRSASLSAKKLVSAPREDSATTSQQPNDGVLRRLLRCFGASKPPQADHDIEEMDTHPVRHKPESLDVLCRISRFTRKELQTMYRGFKQDCPGGIVNEETFKSIYAQFFPQGDSSAYAHFVFNAFDKQKSGSLSFEEFVLTLSVLCRGSLDEKLQWAFALYDVNGDGVISRDELVKVVTAIYDLMGTYTEPPITGSIVLEHVDSIYQKISLSSCNDPITWEKFHDLCHNDEEILASVTMFDTVI